MRRRLILLTGGLFLLFGVGYVASLLLYGDSVPRGVHVQGIDLSGKSPAQARALLADRLAGPAGQPFAVIAVNVLSAVEPQRTGLRVDLEATVEEARSAGPWARLRALVGARRDVDPVPVLHEDLLADYLKTLAARVERPVREGAVTFAGVTPTAVAPQPGRSLDVPGSIDAIRSGYLHVAADTSLRLPVKESEPQTTDDDVADAMKVAVAAVSAPITVDVEGKPLEVRPADLAKGLTFVAKDAGLQPSLDAELVLDSVGTRLEAVEQLPRDATFDVTSGHPVLVPSRDGRTVRPDELTSALLGVLADPAPRHASVALKVTPPRVTTERARGLGIREVIGTFTTRHPCCAPRVKNIHTIADIVDGYVVLPGETFSLNGVVGKRDTARGFVQAPQILRGQFVKDVGGGVSQFATTTFNAVFFSGMKDIEHHPHSYYISRYPPGREATVSFPHPDLRWQDDAPTGVLIKTSYTERSITVTFWGTKRYDIESVSGPRTRVKPFGKEYVDRPDCTPASGAEGFDIVVTRIFKDLTGNVRKREPFKTRYLPEPNFICGPPPPGQPAKQPPPSR
jgi:vancomycin resistance protein YoaR